MSTKTESIESEVLQKKMNYSVCIPNGYEDKSLPVLYFLHGRTGNEQILSQLGMDEMMDDMVAKGSIKPLIIVCPNMDNSRGINSSQTYEEVRGKYSIVHKGRYEDI